MKDFEFLKWIYERLRFRHGERQDVDYMIKLKSLVEELKASGLDGFEKTKISSANIIYNHPTTIAEFESVYREEYKQELEGCDRWIKWCEKRDDTPWRKLPPRNAVGSRLQQHQNGATAAGAEAGGAEPEKTGNRWQNGGLNNPNESV